MRLVGRIALMAPPKRSRKDMVCGRPLPQYVEANLYTRKRVESIKSQSNGECLPRPEFRERSLALWAARAGDATRLDCEFETRLWTRVSLHLVAHLLGPSSFRFSNHDILPTTSLEKSSHKGGGRGAFSSTLGGEIVSGPSVHLILS